LHRQVAPVVRAPVSPGPAADSRLSQSPDGQMVPSMMDLGLKIPPGTIYSRENDDIYYHLPFTSIYYIWMNQNKVDKTIIKHP
jgi:hypothetical protein